jgi:hypothetical protein
MSATTVRVLPDHITAGRPGNACDCAFALAVREALAAEGKAVKNIHVGADDVGDPASWCVRVTLYDAIGPDVSGTGLIAAITPETVAWIVAFDACRDVEPIEVALTWEPAS